MEYSVSASLMLVLLSLLSGMANAEVLGATALLSFSCMILGWVAEFCFRLGVVIERWEMDPSKRPNEEDGVPLVTQDPFSGLAHSLPIMCRTIALVSHLLGWLCVVYPWFFILMRYLAIFQSPGGCPSGVGSLSPPDWLRWVFVGQAILFLLFGLVQVYQFRYPMERMKPEAAYIVLSLGAKTLLGLTVSANLLMGE